MMEENEDLDLPSHSDKKSNSSNESMASSSNINEDQDLTDAIEDEDSVTDLKKLQNQAQHSFHSSRDNNGFSDAETDDLSHDYNNLEEIKDEAQEKSSVSLIGEAERVERIKDLEIENCKNQSLISLQSAKITSIGDLNEMRRQENNRLVEQVQNLQVQLDSALIREKKLTKEVESLTGNNIPAKLERSRLIALTEKLSKEKEEYINQLNDKDSELLKLKKHIQEADLKNQEITQAFETKTMFFQNEIKRNEDYQAEMLENIKNLNEKVANLEKEKFELETNFRNFSATKNSFVKIQENKLASQQKEVENLHKEVNMKAQEISRLKFSFESEVKKYQENLNTSLEEAKLSSMEEVKKLSAKLEATKVELNNANNTILSLGSGGQETFSASVIAKDAKANISHMVTELVTLKAQTMKDSQIIKKLRNKVKSLEIESEEKAPLIEALKKEYDTLLNTFDTVNDKYENISSKASELKVEVKILSQQKDLVTDKLMALKQKNDDLSKQIVCLLSQKDTQQSDLFFNNKERSQPVLATLFQTSSELTNSNDIISNNLVEFKNIQELQEKNIELLQTVRQLTAELESVEQVSNVSKRDKDLETKFLSLSKQFQEIKKQRVRQEEMIHSLSKQRDLYKSLIVTENPRLTESVPQIESHVKAKTVTIQKHEQLINEYSEFKEQAAVSENKMNDIISKLRNDVYENSKKVALYEAENNYLKQQVKTIKNKHKFEIAEIEKLKKSEIHLENSISQLENILERKDQEVLAIQSREKQIAKENQSLTVQNSLLQQESEQLKTLYNEARHQRDEQTQFLDSYNSMEQNLKSEHARTVRSLEQLIEDLRLQVDDSNRSLNQVRSSSELEIAKWRKHAEDLEEKVNEAIEEVEKKKDYITTLKTEITVLQTQETSLKDQLSEANKVAQQIRLIKLDHARNRLEISDTLQSEFNDEDVELDSQNVEKLVLRLDEVKKELKDKTEAMETLRTIAESAENALNDLKKATDIEKEQLEQKILQSDKAIAEGSQQSEELSRTISQKEKKISEQNMKLEDLKFRVQEVTQKLETKSALYEELKVRLDTSLDEDGTYEAKYGREVKLHAESVTRLEQVRAQLNEAKKAKTKAEIELSSLKVLSKKGVEHIEKEKASLQRQTNLYKVEALEHKRQAALLNEQVKILNRQLKAFQEKQVGAEVSIQPLNSEIELRRLRDLLDIANEQKEKAILSQTQQENELMRIKEELQKTRKILEEMRLETESLKQRKADSVVLSKEENDRMIAAVDENVVLRNFNVHLTKKVKELESLSENQKSREVEIEARMKELAKEEKKIQLEAQTSMLKAESLSKEILAYKTRHQALMKRFGERVDAETHSKVVHEMEMLKKDKEVLSSKNLELVQQLEKLSKKQNENDDIDDLRAKLEQAIETRNKLRDAARKYRDNFRESEQLRKDLESRLNKCEEAPNVAIEENAVVISEKPCLQPPQEAPVVGQKRDLQTSNTILSTTASTGEPEQKKIKQMEVQTTETESLSVSTKQLSKAQILKAKLAKKRREQLLKRKLEEQKKLSDTS